MEMNVYIEHIAVTIQNHHLDNLLNMGVATKSKSRQDKMLWYCFSFLNLLRNYSSDTPWETELQSLL